MGMMILNHYKEILVGRRIDHPSGFWQMPQGGIDENEDPEQAVWREMEEEIGTNKAKLIKISKQWIKYDIPKETLKRTLPGVPTIKCGVEVYRQYYTEDFDQIYSPQRQYPHIV